MELALKFWNFLSRLPAVWLIVWMGLFALSVALVLLMRTRWGQSQPLRKCAVLSLLAHAVLGCMATTVKLVSDTTRAGGQPPIRVALASLNERSGEQSESLGREDEPRPWDSPAIESAEPPAQPPERPDIAPRDLPSRSRDNRVAAASGDSPVFTLPEREKQAPDADRLEANSGATRRTATRSSPIEVPTPRRKSAPATQVPSTGVEIERQVEQQKSVTDLQPGRATDVLADRAMLPIPQLATDRRTELPAPELDAGLDVPLRTTSPLPAMRVDAPSTDAPAELPQSVASNTDRQTNSTSSPSSDAAGASRSGAPSSGNHQASAAPDEAGPPGRHKLPTIYRQRFAHDRQKTAARNGGGPATEAAVDLALHWLAANQQQDGSWNAARHGAGREVRVFGHDRKQAGSQADTGVTGLAMLTFLGAGHTHQRGEYADNVRRAVNYLASQQAADGNLSGGASLFAKMYCHGIATFACGEAYAMTGDNRLLPMLRAAIGYTIAAQEPRTGGWRYQPGDQGDTSQLGWQIMALKSAALGGLQSPDATRGRALHFLDSVTAGDHRGLASYRPRQPVSRAMTAEALFCRHLLNASPSTAAIQEASDFLLAEKPSASGKMNLYYWYYATLVLYQTQSEAWQKWNEALKETLVSSQRRDGTLAGSWDPDTIWGGYGGRVYSTAMAALCLEVYYRYLPVYVEVSRGHVELK